MKDINILINNDDPKNHKVCFADDYVGINGENLQGNIVFKFKNFVEGHARAEVIIDNQDGYIELEQVDDTYIMPIKSSLLTSDFIIMQLVIDEPAKRAEKIELPVWKSEAFTLKVGYSINATSTIPEDYPSWIEILDDLRTQTEEAIEKASNVNISSEQLSDGVKVITTNQDGEETTTIVPQGPQGEPGVPGAVKTIPVETLPTEDIETDAIYLLPIPKIEVNELPSTGEPKTIYIVIGTGKRYIYESEQWVEVTNDNNYFEYVYINKKWEELGEIGVQVDLTDYVKNTDYATSSKGGVVKTSNYYDTELDSSGALRSKVVSYSGYPSESNNAFISKGTLENVLTNRIGNIQTLLDDLDTGSGV